MNARAVTARFYFSFRSPYSWLAYRDLVDRHPDLAARLEWRPFFEPDPRSLQMLTDAGGRFPYVAMSRAKALYILQDVRRLAAKRGLAMAWPVDRDPCWEVPHLAYLVAERAGCGPEFIAAVYRERWERGHDICDPATMAAVGAELGLDAEALRTAADDPGWRAEGLRALQAVDADGVFGVPFFVVKRERFWGVDRLDDLVAALRALPGEPDEDGAGGDAPALAVAAASDQGHAGGCG